MTLTNLVQFHSWRDTGGVRLLLKASDLVSFGSCSAGEVVFDSFLCYILYACTPAALSTVMPWMFMKLLE